MKIGANYLGNGRCEFVVWAPFLKKVTVKIVSSALSKESAECEVRGVEQQDAQRTTHHAQSSGPEPEARIIPLSKDERGYWKTLAEGVFPGTLYLYQLDSLHDPSPPSLTAERTAYHGNEWFPFPLSPGSENSPPCRRGQGEGRSVEQGSGGMGGMGTDLINLSPFCPSRPAGSRPHKERPDPASQFQPQGVHKPSQVVDHRDSAFNWEDGCWRGWQLSRMIIYELHVGTFTQTGTFEAVIPRLDELKDIGINTIEIMPVSQFPGERNWGYDGVYPFAVQNSYGGPEGLKKLVNESHKRSMSVILDVVYNHFGPEGNYLRDFGPYFSIRYKTPWGEAINFDDAHSDEVRNFFIENALSWFQNYHLDALRLDAIHAIFDMSARPFLQDLARRVEEFSRHAGSPSVSPSGNPCSSGICGTGIGRKFYLIAENDLNDPKVIRPRELGGYGLDGYWCDDFHHALHTLLTGESNGYYLDFAARPCGTGNPSSSGRVEEWESGRVKNAPTPQRSNAPTPCSSGIEHLAKSLREGFVYSGQYSRYRSKSHGNSSLDIGADQMVVFSQNHDQVGNRMLGERLSTLVDFESLKLAAGVVLLSPFIPLLFMGEEYGETAPFFYFISHDDPALIEAVRKGRKEEFKEFTWTESPPDPYDVQTFLNSKIRWETRKNGTGKEGMSSRISQNGKQGILLNFYQDLITIRKDVPALSNLDKRCLDVCGFEDDLILFMKRWENNRALQPSEQHTMATSGFHSDPGSGNSDLGSGNCILCIFSFNQADRTLSASPYRGEWRKIFDSSDQAWQGPGAILPESINPGQEITIRGRSLGAELWGHHI